MVRRIEPERLHRKLIPRLFAAGVLGGLLLAGCATVPPAPSGFLGDYSALKPDAKEPKILYYEKPNVRWMTYTKLMIDPVQVYYSPAAKHRQIEPEELKKLTDYARVALVEAVKDTYPVVHAPGPGVLRLRAAITDLVPASPAVNIVATAAIMLPVDMGGAAMEAEFLDSQTNERLGAVVDRKIGSPFSPGDFVGGFTTWGHAKTAFDGWANMLRESLDEVHGIKK